MSVKGFVSNGAVHRYDYNALDNKPFVDGSLLTKDIKDALLQLAANIAYVDNHGATYYQELYDALYSTSWDVTNTLTGCITSNPATQITKGAPYSATLTAATGYKMTGAAVTIKMGGLDITSSAYDSGVITIAAVTGDLIISVTAVLLDLLSISAVYTQSGEVYTDDPLRVLKADLVVTATYEGGETVTLPSTAYTLSGDISTAGTQTITVTYSGETTTFTVTVTAPLYSIPDFAEKSLTVGGKTAKVKKENGVYTYSGDYSNAAYLYPDASTVSDTKSSTLWFSITQGSVVKAQLIDMTYSNPNSASHQFDYKFAQVEAGTSNTLITNFALPANSSGTEALAEYNNSDFAARNISCVSLQFRDTMTNDCSITFKYRLWVNNVRYL